MSPLHVVILAAGQGSRMKSALPKVLHPIAGRPMLHHVIETAKLLGAEKIHTVIGHGADRVREATDEASVNWVSQSEQLGTGHAVAQALPDLPDDARVLVLYGDVPLTRHETLEGLVGTLDDNTLGLLTVTMDNPQGYGRIVRDANGDVQSIVEQKDASAEQQQIREVNTGILAVSAKHLKSWLPTLSNSNAQGEYYLTDIIAMAVAQGLGVSVSQPENPFEVQGVNNRLQLAELERWFQRQQADRLMTEGATLADPARVDVRGELSIGNDLWIDVNVVFEGKVSLGSNVSIGPGCVIKDATIADGAEIKAISYVGDASLGRNVNVGAGTITCNYDGVNKYQTVLGDGVFVGSNTALVAPVTVAAEATIGAGSTITRDVADHELAVARGRQRNIAGWEKPKKH